LNTAALHHADARQGHTPRRRKIITLGKRDTLQARRQAAAYLMTPAMTQKLFSEIAPKFADRAGGYTRIIHGGTRVGDGAKVAILELVGYEFKKKEKKEKSKVEEAVEAKAKPASATITRPLRGTGAGFFLPTRALRG